MSDRNPYLAGIAARQVIQYIRTGVSSAYDKDVFPVIFAWIREISRVNYLAPEILDTWPYGNFWHAFPPCCNDQIRARIAAVVRVDMPDIVFAVHGGHACFELDFSIQPIGIFGQIVDN